MSYEPFPEEFPVLSGRGLTLRALIEDDLPAWFVRLSDVGAAALAGDPVADSIADVVEALEYYRRAFRERTALRWAIVPDELGVSVGSIGFVGLDPVARTAEIGGAVGRDHWGRGIATRAAHLVIEFGFSSLELAAIEAVVLPENDRTLRILRRLGFSPSSAPCPAERTVTGRPDSVLHVLRRG